MALDILPDELLLIIVSFVRPLDIEAFTSTCRRIHTIGEVRLAAHRALKARYGSLLIRDREYMEEGLQTDLTIINHPIRLFSDILDDPWIADYVNYICFECDQRGLYTTDLAEEETAILQTLRQREDVLSMPAFNFLTGDKREEWQEGILYSQPETLFAALLPLLSSLTRLRLTGFNYREDLLSEIYEHAQNTSTAILPQLTTVEAYQEHRQQGFLGQTLTLFSQFPSIKKLVGNCIVVDEDAFPSSAYSYASAVEVIALTDSGFHTKSDLSRVLQSTKTLKEFRYSGGHRMNPILIIDCKDIVEVLREHVAETLEVLSLTATDDWQSPVGSLQGFKKLRELEIDFELLGKGEDDESDMDDEDNELESGFHKAPSANEEETVPRAVDILPTSIECIVLKLQGHEDDIPAFLEDLETEEGPALPNLKKFVYHGRTLEDDAKAILKDAGLSIGRRQGYPFKASHDRFWDEDPGLPRDE